LPGRAETDLPDFSALVRADANTDRNFQKKQADEKMR
jgi:hypothetical protein